MLNYQRSLNVAFQALSDPTRRRILERLSNGPVSVSDIAAPISMSLPAVHQHLQVLEEAGLIVSEKKGRIRQCRVNAKGLGVAEDWILNRRTLWERRLDALESHLARDAGKN